MMYITEITSPIGQLTLASDGAALTGLWIQDQKYFGSTLGDDPRISPDLPIFQETCDWLDAYFSGAPLRARPNLSPKGSPFRQAGWKLLLEIPHGETSTYGKLAEQLRQRGIPASAQAVGGAVGHNPIMILIPCHRILGADGSLTGYAGGLDVKRSLLSLETLYK